MSASYCRLSWILILSALLAACGGGGAGSSTPNPNPNPPPSSGPSGPPSVPAVTYQGASGPSDLNHANAGARADALYAAFVVPFDLADLTIAASPAPGQWIDTVEAGPNGGSVHVTGRTTADGTGWVAGAFSGYRDGDTTIDGLQLDETVQVPSPGNGQQHELDLNRDGLMDFAYLTGDGRRVILAMALGWND